MSDNKQRAAMRNQDRFASEFSRWVHYACGDDFFLSDIDSAVISLKCRSARRLLAHGPWRDNRRPLADHVFNGTLLL